MKLTIITVLLLYIINVYIMTVDTTINVGISSVKTIDVNIYLMYLI
jgi:hypothetical protein